LIVISYSKIELSTGVSVLLLTIDNLKNAVKKLEDSMKIATKEMETQSEAVEGT